MPAGLPGPVVEALDRYVLGAAIKDVAGLKRHPKLRRRPRFIAFATWLLAHAQRRWGAADPALAGAPLTRLYTILVVALRVAAGVFWSLGPRSVAPQVQALVRTHAERVGAVSGYVGLADSESPVVRISLLLRAMGRRAAAVRLVAARVQSGLPCARSSELLARWLTEVGDERAAKLLPAAAPSPDVARPVPHVPPRLRYGVVVLTMFDTPVFRASVRSLLNSDFSGQIVVVEEGNEEREQCREFCAGHGITYVKATSWQGCAAGLNLGIAHLGPDADVVLSSHNDVLWPSRWFADLDRAWDAVWDSDKVGLLNLGYLQINSRVDPSLTDLFMRGRYDDLAWVLRAMREVPSTSHQVQDVQARPGESPFGLARDPWVDWMPDLRQQSGRYSVGASFSLRLWREIGGFDPDLVYAFDLQFLHHALTRRRWALFVNTPPLIHLKSSDTEHIAPEKLSQIGTRFLTSTYDGFHREYGWHIEHFLNLFFSESTIVHRDAIVRAANAGRFDDIEFVFDDFAARLATRTLTNCELTWCRVRAQCPHVAVS